LAAWWEIPQPPAEVLVLRATIKQSQHDFVAALADLDQAAKLAPDDAQVWLTRATILTVLGRYDEARRACAPLARLAPGLIATTAAATVNSLNGNGERSCEILNGVLESQSNADESDKIWALTILAETSARLGHSTDAENYFRQALAFKRRDVYLLGAFADYLLDQGRAREVVALLKDETKADGLLLRLCLAEAAVAPSGQNFKAHRESLNARFEAGRLRGDSIHNREESRFTLTVLRQPTAALRLAQANWQVQREPADARVLLEAALATRDRAAAEPVLEFMERHRLQDVALAKLATQLKAIPQ
jgi:tetratricopeptide (TPR) repeat protein